jgi:hypothetical protein
MCHKILSYAFQRRNFMVRKLFFLLAAFSFALPAAAQTPQQTFVAPGRYEIECVASGQVLDVSTSDNQQVQQYTRSDHENQQWDIQPAGGGYFHIRSVATGKVLSLSNGSSQDGTKVIVYQQQGGEGQLWQIVGVAPAQFQIISKYGKALDLPGGSNERGTHMQIWSSTGGRNQRFRLVLVGSFPNSAGWGANSSAPWASQPGGSPDAESWRGTQAARACRAEANRRIADLPSSEITVDPVSRDERGNLIVMWKTSRGSSGYCRVDPSNRIVEFKVEDMSP